MLSGHDLPKLSEVPTGWRLVRTGRSEVGDKYWRPADRSWMPLTGADLKCGMEVNTDGMPTIIRKERE